MTPDKRAFEALLDELLGASFDQDWPAEQKARAAVLAAYTDLEERERMRLAGISTAALGYWKEGDSIYPDYDTVALRDVAKLYAKYDELYQARDAAAGREGQAVSSIDHWQKRGHHVCPECNGARVRSYRQADHLGGQYVDVPCECTHPAPKAVAANWTDADLCRMWKAAGGSFHGPHIETGTMPESKLLPFLRSLAAAPARGGEEG